ncbi:MAG: ferritin-like domain-containing protein [Acidobacteriota bacterium]|nr:ferritin-like domain-containing protein [Acidobacteriota bacterium]MDH3786043.1 ferritin-like domain-containing protein [Acidobacteriota bacterium]
MSERKKLIERLNDALGWEMRAMTMYAHYAAYVRGIYRLQLKPFFDSEATESLTHSNIVRGAIVKLGGVARTDADTTEIIHTDDYQIMLSEAMKTEVHAAKSYREILDGGGLDSELSDQVEQIFFAESRSVEEIHLLGIDA